jgi:hypothetical protein
LYAAVMLQPAVERAAFLAQHSADDLELQRVVGELLARRSTTTLRPHRGAEPGPVALATRSSHTNADWPT